MAVLAPQARRFGRSAEAFVEYATQDLRRVSQRGNALRYVRGMLVGEGRKSLERVAVRAGWSTGEYHSVQHFVADAPWDWTSVLQRCAERISPQIDARAWVLDDTSFPKSGYASPGVKRQYCGQLGKRANCQVGVSLHAAGERHTLPLGWALYLPADWIEDPARLRRAKVPEGTVFKTKHELALELIDQARQWDIDERPVLGDQAYGDSTELRLQIAASAR
jgi:SRSO17 transposase